AHLACSRRTDHDAIRARIDHGTGSALEYHRVLAQRLERRGPGRDAQMRWRWLDRADVPRPPSASLATTRAIRERAYDAPRRDQRDRRRRPALVVEPEATVRTTP